ncbi:MAG: RNA polymerase sigma-70 factor (ECF subfamily) [Pseudorhodobacter sp.]|jgi:RNA polymerase sigma-70 factor (ECF subfamily)
MVMALDQQSDIPDETLLVLYANGDRAAARALTLRLTPRVLGYASRLLGGDRAEAEDVAQEAMLRLWKIAPEWRQGEAKVSTWLYRVVTNLCTDKLRGRLRRRAVALEDGAEIADYAQSVEANLMDTDRMDALQMALKELPERQRQAVVLRHIEGLSNPEIADVLDIGVEAVESLTARGKRALASILAGRKADLGYGEGG